jgi:hypothetical protein
MITINKAICCYLSLLNKEFLRDVYTNEMIHQSHLSLEHIIPKRVFNNKKDANHWKNLAFCDKRINSLRSDFRLGDPDDIYDYRNKSIKIVLNSVNQTGGILVPCERIYFPTLQADLGLLSRSIIDMLHLYPYLYGRLDQIIESNDFLEKYHNKPISEFERKRDKLQKNLNKLSSSL